MDFNKTSNPIFGGKTFERTFADSFSETMTARGAINKTIILFLVVVFAASFTWKIAFSGGAIGGWMIGGIIGGLIAAMVTVFKPQWAAISAPIYAVFEGLLLGGLSAMFAAMYSGIVIKAVMLTFGTLFTMLFLYKTGIVKVTEKFKMGVIAATGAVALFYFVNMIFGFFGMGFQFGGLLGIGISLVIVGIAALNLVLDFDFIEKASHERLPKYMEWYAAFGLMVTLIWLYIEILRLLSLLANRD